MEKNSNDIRRETDISTSRWLFLVCFLVYCSSYIARGSFSFVRAVMIEEGVVSVGVAASISAAYFVFYALGQLVNGFLGDRISPFWMVSVGLCVVIASNAAMLMSQPSWLYIVWWGINGYGHSMLWSPVFFVLSNIINQKTRVFALTAISICSPLGKILSALVSGAAISGGRWQTVFLVVSFIVTAVLMFWVARYLSLKKRMVISVDKIEAKDAPKRVGRKRIFSILLASGVAIMLPAMLVHGLFYNGVVELIPTILYEEYELSAMMSAIVEIIIPILSIVGVFFANFVYYKIFKENDMRSATFLMGITLIPIGIMLLLGIFKTDGYMIGKYADAIIFVTTYAFVYLFQFAFNHVVIVLMSARFARFSCASTVSGMANAINYGGSAISTYGMTYALMKLQLWQTVLIWGGVLVAATVFVSLAQHRWKAFLKEF